MAKQAGKAPTLTDVARVAGTSTAVVSYVMNNGPRPVAAATRERVLAAAAELDYRPNRIARALRSRTTGVVGLILADASNPYFGALARHVEQALDKRGKLTLTGNAGYSPHRQEHLADKFLAAQVDGLIIVFADGGADVATQVKRAGVPAVYVHNQPEGGQAPAVTADNEDAVQQAVAHLRGHGHTRIAFLAGPRDAGPVGRRRATWETALAGTGAPLLRCEYSRAAAAALTGQLISDGSVPAALITATDEQAIGVLAAARAHRLAVPERLAVISLDGTPDSAYTAPALTVTQQPLESMAAQAVDLLLGGEAAAPPALSAPLVIRGSCGCAATDS
ncbi:LacI family transcriptional regulator [Streptomyces sp. NBC_00257]|uniref:LacI family DNA-binding transcriptional regulator n=1 Tax=unclassified Streptomyces TaxID=2593676 RepID=UPI00225AC289|nr:MULTISPECIES: LacI family DNA-binding transcriptional regulator [unclassified Streptomyces]MCX5426313.1 LacI family transcriptional regulator [Streptomyces sp. NBC_00062]WSW10276.1 LacI family transcriptional regulator [Streptomyces sp. NBC_01005]WTC99783.1 LacI family transcriptional regulator [Streptomyces sp. NBC_01650]